MDLGYSDNTGFLSSIRLAIYFIFHHDTMKLDGCTVELKPEHKFKTHACYTLCLKNPCAMISEPESNHFRMIGSGFFDFSIFTQLR